MTDQLADREASSFRVLATSAGFEPGFRSGGPIRSVARIVDTMSDRSELLLITRDRDFGSAYPYPDLSGRWISRGRSRIFYLNTIRVGQWLRLRRELSAIQFDCLYVNSFWNPVFTVIPIIAARLRLIRARTVLIAPRGELSQGALSLKNKKKRLFLKGWGPLLRRMDVMWHASNEVEASQIRDVFPWAQVEVNADQIALPAEPILATAANEGPARLVFIGRVSPKKNLELTLRTLRALSKPVEFDIYGPLEDESYWSNCQKIIRQVPAFVQVKYRGELASSEVPRTFSEYDAFIFPTLGENFGHAIAESLSASCPVICSERTPWTPVLESGGGAVVRDLTVAGLGKEVERIAAMNASERLRARQEAGRAYLLWRKEVHGPNILEQVRLAEWAFRK